MHRMTAGYPAGHPVCQPAQWSRMVSIPLALPALQAPIYATLPVVKMGQMFMYDLYLAQQASQDFQAFTLDDVDAAFDVHRVHSLKFQQSVRLEGKCQNASLRCSVAGMVLPLPA